MSAILVLLIIVAVFSIVWPIFFVVPTPRLIWMLWRLPGPWSLPVIGPAHKFPFLTNAVLMHWMKKYVRFGNSAVSAFWVAGNPMVALNDATHIEVILSSPKYINKGIEYSTFDFWLQEGLLISSGNKWHTRRKLLTPTFHFKILEDKSKVMYVHARKFVNRLLEANGQPFEASEIIASSTLEIIGETAMGVSLNRQDDLCSKYVAAIRRATDGLISRVLSVYKFKPHVWALSREGARNLKDVKFLHDFTSNIIAQRRAVFAQSKNKDETSDSDIGERKKQAFLDTLLELDETNEGRLTDSDIREEVDTFLFEGHDTTAVAIMFSLFELGHNPEAQELAYKEQYEIFGDDSRDATMEDLQNMQYLERVIKECLRLYPPVPYLSRLIKEDVHLNGVRTIPRDATIVIMPYFVHRNPKYYPNPNKFDPDRFLPEECKNRHPFSYIPFSAGPRNCIGQKFAMMELKALLSTVIRFTKVESITKKSELLLVPVVILRTVNPILIRVVPRR